MAGVRRGDTVLLPALICREVVASVRSVGAEPAYYRVGEDLQFDAAQQEPAGAKAIVAVNYFGFPQVMEPFRSYCRSTGAFLIEDNCQGLLSRDDTGELLGSRGDFGLLSLRKTLAVPDGAALLVNGTRTWEISDGDYPPGPSREPLSFRAKKMARWLLPLAGPTPVRVARRVTRLARRLKTGHEILPSDEAAERNMPPVSLASSGLSGYISRVNVPEEIARRRELYRWLDSLLRDLPVRPAFSCLPELAVPFGYPFYVNDAQAPLVSMRLGRFGLECFKWPDLPSAVLNDAPEHYRCLRVVGFLW